MQDEAVLDFQSKESIVHVNFLLVKDGPFDSQGGGGGGYSFYRC